MDQSLAGKTLLNRYFLRENIGHGGMADVYLAWDNLRSTRMAIKVLRGHLSQSPKLLRMFEQEAKLLRQLEHPNIVRLYDFEVDGDISFLVMDWIDGSNLREAIAERKRPFSLAETSAVLQPVSTALNYAHQHEIYHCDVKPANILLHHDGRVLLTDFGVARIAAESKGGGTPPYMGPEQFLTGKVDGRTDVYALGITLFEMLTGGYLPFTGTSLDSVGSTTRERISWEHINRPVPSPRIHNRHLSAAVELTVLTALSKSADERYPTAMALAEAFEQARTVSDERDTTVWSTFQLPQIPRPTFQSPPSRPKDSPPQQVPFVRPSRPPTSSGYMDGPRLLGRVGEMKGREIIIPPGGLSIGRGANNHLHLSDRSVSRQHAAIIRTKRGVYVQDQGSSLGTYVNGVSVQGTIVLKDGDVIRIGYQQEFQFRQK